MPRPYKPTLPYWMIDTRVRIGRSGGGAEIQPFLYIKWPPLHVLVHVFYRFIVISSSSYKARVLGHDEFGLLDPIEP